jgi:hypothetical protein
MEPITIIGGVIAATGVGLGIGVGARLLPLALRAHRDLQTWKRSEESNLRRRIADHEKERLLLASPQGRKRDSSIAGVSGGALRHTDGSYSCAWEAQPAPTMLAHEHVIESRCDELARMLAVDKPAGTVIQFRFSSGPDPGNAIIAHLEACGDPSLLHTEAARLHGMNIDFYAMRADTHSYRRQALSLWVRVPTRQKGDDANNGVGAFIPAALDEIGKHGVTKLPQAIRASWAETVDDGVVRRLLRDECEARERAERVFRLVERECPLSMRRFSRQELWEAIYLGHRQNARSVPILPDVSGFDIRDYLCGETIEGSGSHVMHGAHPAAIVSMFTPPQPAITADALRALTLNPALNFRHTVIAEFVYLDQRKATKRLDRRIRQVRRSYTRADGRSKQSPEARAALLDLETVRDHVTGSREALIDMRLYAIVYAEPARTRGEQRQSLDNLDRYCERMVTAMQSIPGVEAAREEPDSLRALYQRTIVGEADHRPIGREITEVAGSLATLAPVESAWEGARRPHTLCSTPTGRLIGLNFFDSARISSPLALVLGEPGSGKSTFMARVINDVLATLPEARVRAVDFGESLGPHVDVTRGRHLRFNIEDRRTVNVWDYPGLELGEMPDETQIALVVMDAMKLARVKPDDNVAEDILTNVITEVYRNEVPRNRAGQLKYEPVHSHLLAVPVGGSAGACRDACISPREVS